MKTVIKNNCGAWLMLGNTHKSLHRHSSTPPPKHRAEMFHGFNSFSNSVRNMETRGRTRINTVNGKILEFHCKTTEKWNEEMKKIWLDPNGWIFSRLRMFQTCVSCKPRVFNWEHAQPDSYSTAPAWIMNDASKFKEPTLCSRGPVIAGMLAPVPRYGTDFCKRSAAFAQNKPFRVKKSCKGGDEGWRWWQTDGGAGFLL